MSAELKRDVDHSSSIIPTRKTAFVVLNSKAGATVSGEEQISQVRRAFERVNVDAEVELVSGEQLAGALSAQTECDVVVVGGGDGSISAAAQILADTGKPVGVLPMGTLNHFAKDLGIPLELEQAAATIARGVTREVDLGEVNGRIFINNSSIGFYARAVEMRDSRREQLGWSKWPALLHSMWRLLRELPHLNVKVSVPNHSRHIKTPFIFVGNNHYELSLASPSKRACLDRGELGVYVAKTSNAAGFLRLALHAAAGRLNEASDCDSMHLSELTIDSARHFLRVAHDGEVTRMRPPLRYRSRPRALKVVVPG